MSKPRIPLSRTYVHMTPKAIRLNDLVAGGMEFGQALAEVDRDFTADGMELRDGVMELREGVLQFHIHQVGAHA